MNWLFCVLISCSLLVPVASVSADETTAPGQQKKAAGDQSAKEYAPGQDKNPDVGANKSKQGDAKAKGEKGKTDKGQFDKGKVDKGTAKTGKVDKGSVDKGGFKPKLPGGNANPPAKVSGGNANPPAKVPGGSTGKAKAKIP